jgi:geranylgeranyl pyrophosphate synthase
MPPLGVLHATGADVIEDCPVPTPLTFPNLRSHGNLCSAKKRPLSKAPMTPPRTDTKLSQPSAKDRFAHALTLVPEIALVEARIRSTFTSDVAIMREIPEYLLSLGGKRIRPILALLCAKALGAEEITEDIVDIAAGIELIHMATLMHDDIIDQSPIRRHKPSAYAKYGTPGTLLSGDFLLTRAFGLCSRLDREIIEATEAACIELVEGETLEIAVPLSQHTPATSLTIATRKTASLFRLAAFCGASLTDSPDEVKESMAQFGESLGIAFQIIDDILDVTSDEATLGKRPGIDIAERKPSLINILWLESGDPAAQRLLLPPDPHTEHDFVEASLSKLRTSPILQRAKDTARHHADVATQNLTKALGGDLNNLTPEGEAIFAVIDFALERVL